MTSLERLTKAYINHKTRVINNPLDQPTAPAGSDFGLILKIWNGRTDEQADGRTHCVKIVITTYY